MNELIEKLEALRMAHRYCEDPWYSCPLAEDGCADDREDECNCFAEKHNRILDEIIEEVRNSPSRTNGNPTLSKMD